MDEMISACTKDSGECTLRGKYLISMPPPFRVIDPVNPVLDFHHHTAVLVRHARAGGVVEEALGLFQGERTYKAVSKRHTARVEQYIPFMLLQVYT